MINKITVDIHRLFPGSKNPPFDVDIWLKTKDGRWGHGRCYKWHDKRVYFEFDCPGSILLGEPKSTFDAWMILPQ